MNMKIGIVTVYESITNLGSFLQTYAMKTLLTELGHEVYILQNVKTLHGHINHTSTLLKS